MKKDELSNEEFVNFFLQTGKEIHYKKGSIIIRPEDTPTGVYFIKKGFVMIYSISEDGSERLHIIYQPNDVFPLMWVLKNEQKKLFYESMDDVILYKVKKESFLNTIKLHPNCMKVLVEHLTENFSIFSDRVDNLEVSRTYPRIVSCLLFFAKQYGKIILTEDGKKTESYKVLAPVTQQDIANFSSMTRETASREISILEKKNIVSYKSHNLVINSIKKLEKELLKTGQN